MSDVREELPLTDREILRYYKRLGSRAIYSGVLRGTKHLGYYTEGDHAWEFRKSQRRMEEELATNLDLPPGSRVLDAGCGMGDVANYLAEYYGLHITGVDLLDFNIEEANKRALAKGVPAITEFMVGNYARAPFEDSTFDGVYTMESLVHVPDTEEALANFFRILKPGGRLVMHEYSHTAVGEMPPKVYKAMTQINELVVMPGFQRFSHGTLESLLYERGFTDISARDITDNIKPMMKVFAMLTAAPYLVSKALGYRPKMPNAMTAVEIYKNQDYFQYNVISASKPDDKLDVDLVEDNRKLTVMINRAFGGQRDGLRSRDLKNRRRRL